MTEPHALHRGTTQFETSPDIKNRRHGKQCHRCGVPITDNAKYCRPCGAWIRRIRASVICAHNRKLERLEALQEKIDGMIYAIVVQPVEQAAQEIRRELSR